MDKCESAARTPVHIEDFAQVRDRYPSGKYEGTHETAAAFIYRGRYGSQVQEFVRRLVFMVLIGNGDAHLKNWSLIYRDRVTSRLAPAYDLVSTFLYRDEVNGPEDMALKLSGARRFEAITLSSFSRLEKWLDDRLGRSEAGLAGVAMHTAERAKRCRWFSTLPVDKMVMHQSGNSGFVPALHSSVSGKSVASPSLGAPKIAMPGTQSTRGRLRAVVRTRTSSRARHHVGMETSESRLAAAARHPADPDPVPSTKAAAAYSLSLLAVVLSPLIGGVIPAALALRLSGQADAEIAHSKGFLLGAAKSRKARRFSYIAFGVAGFVTAAWLVWWVFRLAAAAGGA